MISKYSTHFFNKMDTEKLVSRLSKSIYSKDDQRFSRAYKQLLRYTDSEQQATQVLLDISESYDDFVWVNEVIEESV